MSLIFLLPQAQLAPLYDFTEVSGRPTDGLQAPRNLHDDEKSSLEKKSSV